MARGPPVGPWLGFITSSKGRQFGSLSVSVKTLIQECKMSLWFLFLCTNHIFPCRDKSILSKKVSNGNIDYSWLKKEEKKKDLHFENSGVHLVPHIDNHNETFNVDDPENSCWSKKSPWLLSSQTQALFILSPTICFLFFPPSTSELNHCHFWTIF